MPESDGGSFVRAVHADKAVIAEVAHVYYSDNDLQNNAITQHAKYVDRCIKYRDRRIGDPKKELSGEISSGEIPVRMMSPYLAAIVHVFHSQAFDSDKRLDLELLSENESLMAGLKGWNTNIRPWKRSRQIKHRFNREGLLIYHEREGGTEPFCEQYIQLYDNGIVEAVDGELMEWVLHSKLLPGTLLESGLRHVIPQIVKCVELLGGAFPILVSMSIRGRPLEYTRISYGQAVSEHKMDIKDGLLALPWMTLDAMPGSFDAVLRPCFDFLARAGGRPRSPNFNSQGFWIGESCDPAE